MTDDDVDPLLMAYVDGELDAEDAARVERRLARDPAARETVRHLTEMGGLLSAAYADTLRESVPARLVEAARATADDAAPARPALHRRIAWAAAVPLLLAGGAALGLWWQGAGGPAGPAGAAPEAALAGAFLHDKRQQALETHLSGDSLRWTEAAAPVAAGEITPLKTYRVDGGYCREYRETVATDDGARTTIGLACREAGSWQVRYELRSGNGV